MRGMMIAAAIVLVAPQLAAARVGFYNTPMGSVIENVPLPTLSGGEAPLLGEAEANVFIFFRPGQENSALALERVVRLEKELADAPVRWVAIVSDNHPRAEVEVLVRRLGLTIPVLIDEGAALYGRLGVILHPVVGLANRKHELVAYEPFRKVHYGAVIKARIEHLLGRVDDRALQRVLDPPANRSGGDRAKSKRNLELAEILFSGKKLDQALTYAQRAAEADPSHAAAHGLVAEILVAMKRCAEAREALTRALELDPKQPRALAARKECGPRS